MDPLLALLIVIIIMGILLGIAIVALSVVLYNFLLLLSEINKKQVATTSDILGAINLETPHLDILGGATTANPSVDDIISDEEDKSYFNPHEFDVDQYKEENEL